jgi:hypothetical protein
VIFYTEYNANGAPAKLDESKVVARLKVKVNKLPMNIESFTITLDDVSKATASMAILWENTHVSIPFTVHTDKSVMASIEKNFNGPESRDFFVAATYYYENGKDIAQAKVWIDKALNNKKAQFWELRQQSLIYFKAGDKKGAIKLAKKSLAASKERGNDDYIKMNEDSIAEWTK